MSERRVRGASRTSVRSPRTVPRHDRTLASSDSVSQAATAQRIPVRHVYDTPDPIVSARNERHDGDIYLPPALQDGWKGRDDVSEYLPYSPALGGGRVGQVRHWPQHTSGPSNRQGTDTQANHHNYRRTHMETGQRVSDRIRLENVMERIVPHTRVAAANGPTTLPVRPRVKTNKYSLSSDEERHYDYRGMQDDESENASRSTEFFSSGTDYTSAVSGSMSDDYPSQPPMDSFNSKNNSHRHRDRLPVLSKSESESTMGESRHVPEKHPFSLAGPDDGTLIKTQQEWAYCTVFVTSVQLLVLMLQLSMCSFAPLDVNPMIGPFPDQFSLWGGKNLYLMLYDNQWWRLITPAVLHVGVLHLAANFFCQLYVVAIFEREWGSVSWAFIYLASELGCAVTSNYCDPDTIAVGSSGALMGIFGAKLAQVVTLSLFEAKSVDVDDVIRFDQLTSVLFGLTLISMLGALTYVDWSGNMGGLATGFFAGIFIFSGSIYRCCGRLVWSVLGLAGLVGPVAYVLYLIVETAAPDEQLADVCEYFRSFFSESYVCGCPWK